jgi:beta-glucosidase
MAGHEEDLDFLLSELTLMEKVDLLTGRGMWRTQAIPRLGIRDLVMTDGAYGVRYSVDQIEGAAGGGVDLRAFLEIVNRRARDMDAAFGASKPATCFPTGSCIANSWDVSLMRELGEALGRECQSLGVDLLLGPGINIRRTPLGGRGYEYYSEDPVVSGDLAAAVINGLQSLGIGASLKHFACNNSEVERTTMDSIVDERTLREIYLLGFERAIRQSDPWTVMSSYNVLNHVQASQNGWLLTKILRDEWEYEGVVISDWHGIKDRPASIVAGNDLDMPESAARKQRLLSALKDSRVPMSLIDRSCRRVLRLIAKTRQRSAPVVVDLVAQHALARRFAAESLVLLKNDDSVLPIDPGATTHIAIVGAAAVKPVIQGSGSATVAASQVDIPLEELRAAAGKNVRLDYFQGYGERSQQNDELRQAAVAGAAAAQVAIIFVHTDQDEDGEGADRTDLRLGAGQDELISAIAATGTRVIVVLASPDAVVMPWLGEVDAVVGTFFAGQGMAGAVADILFGKDNPSGKLTVTFPRRLEDTPAYLSYPGENGRHHYAEGIYVGYRYFDKRNIEPLFPFGFGLSYTKFSYANLRIEKAEIRDQEPLSLSFDLTNVGSVTGKEICQIYLHWPSSKVHRAVNELKVFRKIKLEPGQSKNITIDIAPRELQYFDTGHGCWLLEGGDLVVRVGSSSREIHLAKSVRCVPRAAPRRKLSPDSQPKFILEDPQAKQRFVEFLRQRLEIDATAASGMLEYCKTSFFGIYTTLNYFFRLNLEEHEIEAVIAQINDDARRPFPASRNTP